MFRADRILARWLHGSKKRHAPRSQAGRRRGKTFLPQVETLEARLAPATLTWTGLGTTNNWSQAANWSTNAIPASADTVVFDSTSGKNATVDASFAGTVTQV